MKLFYIGIERLERRRIIFNIVDVRNKIANLKVLYQYKHMYIDHAWSAVAFLQTQINMEIKNADKLTSSAIQ